MSRNHAGWIFIIIMTALVAVPLNLNAELVERAQGGKKKEGPLKVILIGAHPDDGEIKAGGTAAKWAALGAEVLIVSVTNGDAGHQNEGGGALARRRAAEARASAAALGVSWKTLGFHDGELEPTLEVRRAVITAIREWDADIVIGPRPNDYHPDHRYTGMVVQDAAYMCAVPNIVPGVPRLEKNPIFMFFSDGFKKPYPFDPIVAVAVDEVMDRKWQALHSMTSQMYEWLPWIDGYLDQVPPASAGDQARKDFLIAHWSPRLDGVDEKYGELKEKRYGAAAKDIKYFELFELCEYGRQPSQEELWEIFPK